MNIQQMNAAWAQQRRASTLAAYARMAAEAMKLKSEIVADEPKAEDEEPKIGETPAEEVSDEEPKAEEPAPEETPDAKLPDEEYARDEDPVQDPPAEENPAE